MLDLGPFGAVTGDVAGSQRLYVVHRTANRPEIVGFEVDLERLRAALLGRAARMPTRLEMEVDIVPRGDRRYADGSLAVLRDLSPLVPGWRVSIRPRDPGIVSRYVSRQRWIYGTTLVLLVAGMVLGVVLVVRDLSRERRLSQLRTDFVANVTHELKTPLTSIRMFAETLQLGRTGSEAERQESLDVIVGETRRLSRLINTVLDFSKIERGEKQYRMAGVNVSEVVRTALNTLKVLAGGTGIHAGSGNRAWRGGRGGRRRSGASGPEPGGQRGQVPLITPGGCGSFCRAETTSSISGCPTRGLGFPKASNGASSRSSIVRVRETTGTPAAPASG